MLLPGKKLGAPGGLAAPGPVRSNDPLVTLREALAAILLLLLLAGLGMLVWHLTRPPGPVPMPAPAGPRTLKEPLALFVAIDESSSMDGSNGNDPDGRRDTDTALLLRWATTKAARARDTVSVARFTEQVATGRPRPLRSASAHDLDAVPAMDGGTAIMPVADWVSSRASTNNHDVAIVVTDALADDARDAARRLAQAADDVIVVQIAREAGDGPAEAFEVPGVTVIRATTERPQAVAASVAERLLEITGQGAR